MILPPASTRHGVIETELGDAGGDLPDLDGGMGARIARIRQKSFDLPEFDVKSGRWVLHGNTFLNGIGCSLAGLRVSIEDSRAVRFGTAGCVRQF
jgi:hypothetical protein